MPDHSTYNVFRPHAWRSCAPRAQKARSATYPLLIINGHAVQAHMPSGSKDLRCQHGSKVGSEMTYAAQVLQGPMNTSSTPSLLPSQRARTSSS